MLENEQFVKQSRDLFHIMLFVGDRCSIVPRSHCRAAFDVYFYNGTAKECQRMIAGGCHLSGWNGFFVKNDCENYCKKGICMCECFLVHNLPFLPLH